MASRPPPAPDDAAAHILIVDDDRRLRELIGRFLAEQGYRVTTASDPADAQVKLNALSFDLLVIDVMMPGMNGFDFVALLRQGGPCSDVPVLMLTARSDTQDRLRGLELGADDYLTKPFEPRELLLRIAAILRRVTPIAAAPAISREFVRFGDFIFRLDRLELWRGEEMMRITERERDILQSLTATPGEQVHRDALGGGTAANDRTIDVQINRLRRKIEADPANPRYLQTVRGIGYRLVVDR